jgi:hypothetical protein
MISNRFKPFSNFFVVQFLQCENCPPPHPPRPRGGAKIRNTHELCTQPVGSLPIVGSPADQLPVPCAYFLLPLPLPLIIGDLPLLFSADHSSPPMMRGSSPSIALSPADYISSACSPPWRTVTGRIEGNSPELFHECRGADLNCGPLDFQSRSPWPLYKKSPGALSK